MTNPITLSWIYLILAGLCEIVWALALKYSHGFSKPVSSIVTLVFMLVSIYLLALAAKQIPISIAYTVWVGIGALGAFLGGIFLLSEKVSFVQVCFFLLIVIGLIGLKLTALKA